MLTVKSAFSTRSAPVAARPTPAPVLNKPLSVTTARAAGASATLVRSKLLDAINSQLGMDALDLMLQIESARDADSLLATRAAAQGAFQKAGLDGAAISALYDSL